MALIFCPECGKEVSDQALACIHCGYPLQAAGGRTPVKGEMKEAGEVVIRMPKYSAFTNANTVVNFTLAGDFIGNLRACETVTAPVYRDCTLVAKCGVVDVDFPVKAGKRTVINVDISGWGVIKLTEDGEASDETRKSSNPILRMHTANPILRVILFTLFILGLLLLFWLLMY